MYVYIYICMCMYVYIYMRDSSHRRDAPPRMTAVPGVTE